ncbi:MAG TPA: hypothetical protein VGH54_05610 [Mycobacterium sp.]|jgi:hypothetical protein|uniref:hypothetical protein n=1 Tax=Mycobacterium sp. TaxID=1785 RepID=UPI002F41FE69
MSSYDKARRQSMDPRKVKWANTPLSERHVQRYMRQPNRRSSDGDPFIVVGLDGVARGWNGKHRGEAARRQGRNLTARVHDERVSGSASTAGCMGLMLVSAVLVGLVRKVRR